MNSERVLRFSNSHSYFPYIGAGSRELIQYCSVTEDFKKILCYYEAFVDEKKRIVENFSMIYFYSEEKLTVEGVRDLLSFVNLLFSLNFDKIKFFCIGEKNLKLFRKFSSLLNGREVGYFFEEEYCISTGKKESKFLFEVLKNDFYLEY